MLELSHLLWYPLVNNHSCNYSSFWWVLFQWLAGHVPFVPITEVWTVHVNCRVLQGTHRRNDDARDFGWDGCEPIYHFSAPAWLGAGRQDGNFNECPGLSNETFLSHESHDIHGLRATIIGMYPLNPFSTYLYLYLYLNLDLDLDLYLYPYSYPYLSLLHGLIYTHP